MKDNIYSRFKKELSRYHKRGYAMDYPFTEVTYDEGNKVNIIYIQVGLSKKGERDPDV